MTEKTCRTCGYWVRRPEKGRTFGYCRHYMKWTLERMKWTPKRRGQCDIWKAKKK